MIRHHSAAALSVWLWLALGTTLAFGQTAELTTEAELRQHQDELFDSMFAHPNDLDLMFQYATVSIRLRDYEAAISTLERMLMYNQDLPRVRLELGAAYFNLGAYENARLYFEQVLADEDADDVARQRAAAFLDEIRTRTARSALHMVTNVGVTYSTNANLAPISDRVVVAGVPGFVLSPDSRSQDDFGVRVLVYGTHTLDLRQPNNDALVTDFSLFGLRYSDVESGNTIFAHVRTGPRLALTNRQDGPTIRPYLEAEYLNGGDRTIYFGAFGGAEYLQPITDNWFGFADLGAGFLDFEDRRNAEDRLSLRLQGGGTYIPSRDLVGRVVGLVRRDSADSDFNSNTEIGARLSGEYHYDSGIASVDRKWAVTAYAEARSRWYDEADPFVDPNTTRREVDLRVGVGHLFAISDGFGVELDVDGLARRSNIQNFDLNDVSVTLSAQYRF